jgi:hypothetical protein
LKSIFSHRDARVSHQSTIRTCIMESDMVNIVQVFSHLDCDAGSLLQSFAVGPTCIQSISFSAYEVVCS